MGAFGLGGAAVTALAFFVGAHAWGYLVLALFLARLLAGLAVKFGNIDLAWLCSSTSGSSSLWSCRRATTQIASRPTVGIRRWLS